MRQPARGFTLVEMMVAVAIIGLLASIAIPNFRNMQHRSKRAERTLVMNAINRAINDYFIREQRYPQDLGNGASLLVLDPNPDWTPGNQRRAFKSQGSATDDWKRLTVVIEGAVHYSYQGWGLVDSTQSPPRTHTIWSIGDLDGDAVIDDLRKQYDYVSDVLQRAPGSPGDCTTEWHLPADFENVF